MKVCLFTALPRFLRIPEALTNCAGSLCHLLYNSVVNRSPYGEFSSVRLLVCFVASVPEEVNRKLPTRNTTVQPTTQTLSATMQSVTDGPTDRRHDDANYPIILCSKRSAKTGCGRNVN